MSTLTPHAPVHDRRRKKDELQRLVRKHEAIERRIIAHRSHGLPTTELWLAMISVEDRLRTESPRAYSHWLAVWLATESAGAHAVGAADPQCLICQNAARPTPRHGYSAEAAR
jgi:hypothetical protein